MLKIEHIYGIFCRLVVFLTLSTLSLHEWLLKLGLEVERSPFVSVLRSLFLKIDTETNYFLACFCCFEYRSRIAIISGLPSAI